MDPLRWNQIEDLFHAAMAQPAEKRLEFLLQACPDDGALRNEVQTLMMRSGPSFLEGSPLTGVQEPGLDALERAGPTKTMPGSPVGVGVQLGPYRLEARLGSGGMGEVFRANDTRLHRTVAIKILPNDRMGHPEHRLRFMQEARAASALNHPNIVTLYDIACDGGTDYVVMEYIAGKSLDKLIKAKGLPLSEAAGYAAQIADALAAAHSAGIVHRDIKPANVIVTAESQVKVLDYGLAKLMGRGSRPDGERADQESALTETGAVMGTVPYMSPEQARAQPVDHRTDIFSLGVVLYELLAGQRPFRGKSQVETLHAVINDPPPPLAHQPPEVNDVLDKALAKDLKDRYYHASDFALDLRRILRRRSQPDAALQKPTGPFRLSAVLAGVLVLAMPAVWWFARRGASASMADGRPLSIAQFTRLTDFPGNEMGAAVSPDGNFVAFLADRDGPFDIFLTQVGSGRFTNMTQGREPNLSVLAIRPVGFSRDGSQIWLHDAYGASSLQIMPLMGGPMRAFLGRKSQGVNWSPDGAQLVFNTSDPGDPVFVADSMGANARQIFVGTPGVHNHFPTWSMDGKWIYFVSGVIAANEMDLYRIPSTGGISERLTKLNSNVGYPTPIDARTLLYIAPDVNGSGPWLWSLDIERRITRRVSFGLEKYTSVEASANGRRLAVGVANPVASLWSVPILDHPAKEGDVKPFPVPTLRALMPRFGGTALFYLASQDAGDGLWRYLDGQVLEIWKGANGALLEPPAVSFDGRRVAFVLRRNGRLQLQIEMGDGTEPQVAAPSLDIRGTASWSPDSKWIVTGGIDSNGPGLFKVAVDRGAPIRLASGSALNPVWSPDGNLIAYADANVGGMSPLRAVRPDGTPVELPEVKLQFEGERIRFSPDGKALVYMQGGSAATQDFWLLDLVTKQSRRLTQLASTASSRTFDITPDGKRIVFDRLRENSDIAIIDLPPVK